MSYRSTSRMSLLTSFTTFGEAMTSSRDPPIGMTTAKVEGPQTSETILAASGASVVWRRTTATRECARKARASTTATRQENSNFFMTRLGSRNEGAFEGTRVFYAQGHEGLVRTPARGRGGHSSFSAVLGRE